MTENMELPNRMNDRAICAGVEVPDDQGPAEGMWKFAEFGDRV
jgi:hypothetical protein